MCQLKNIECMAPGIECALCPANIVLHGDDKDVPPMMRRTGYPQGGKFAQKESEPTTTNTDGVCYLPFQLEWGARDHPRNSDS
jgi:hypothetical protein